MIGQPEATKVVQRRLDELGIGDVLEAAVATDFKGAPGGVVVVEVFDRKSGERVARESFRPHMARLRQPDYGMYPEHEEGPRMVQRVIDQLGGYLRTKESRGLPRFVVFGSRRRRGR